MKTQTNFWQEEARRYAANAHFWRGKADAMRKLLEEIADIKIAEDEIEENKLVDTVNMVRYFLQQWDRKQETDPEGIMAVRNPKRRSLKVP